MTIKISVADAVENHLIEVRGDLAANSMRNRKSYLTRFAAHLGPIQLASVAPAHIAGYMASLDTLGNGSYNNVRIDLKAFIEWANIYDYINPSSYPKIVSLLGKKRPYQPKPKIRVPAKDFPALLDAAEEKHPRDRALIALGLYLMIRTQSEGAPLRLADLNVKEWTVHVSRAKKKTPFVDEVQCSLELEAELTYWLEYYKREVGFNGNNIDFIAQHPKYFLAPSLATHPRRSDTDGKYRVAGPEDYHLRPAMKATNLNVVARKALGQIGVPLIDDDGRSTYEAMHCLRRSAARAYLDERREEDGSNDVDILVDLMAWLGHADIKTTMNYVGYDVERLRRNKRIKGQFMYGSTPSRLVGQVLGENVIPIRKDA